jgi:hypothetical protein
MNKSGKRIAFTQPSQETRQPVTVADAWVRGETETETSSSAASSPEPPAGKMARLTIDLPPDLRDRFKAACAMHRTKMVDEIRQFIEEWTQKNGKP